MTTASNTDSTTIRAFVASYLDSCAGMWVDLSDFSSESEVYAHVAENCPRWASLVQWDAEAETCGGDVLIADTEGARFSSLSERLEIAELLSSYSDDEQDVILAILKYEDVSRAKSMMEDSFQGIYEDLESWAETFIDETGALESMPENLRYYFDYEKYARDCEMGGDVCTYDLDGGGVAVFWNN